MPSRAREYVVRTLSAVALALPAIAAWAAGREAFALFAAAIGLLMLYEWVRLTGDAAKPWIDWALLAVGIVAAGLLVVFAGADLALAGIAVTGAAAAALALLRGSGRALWPGLGALYVGVPVIGLIWLYDRPEIGKDLVLWLILTVAATDTGAYFAGRALGGPKFAPRISPGKTWAGTLGGMFCAIVVGVGAGTWLDLGTAGALAAAALVVTMAAQIGDLFESALKRMFRVKDAGTILPGHGGVLDRMDGLAAAVVVVASMAWLAGGDPRQWL
jgi:phosphatidate cytidylyltransferase